MREDNDTLLAGLAPEELAPEELAPEELAPEELVPGALAGKVAVVTGVGGAGTVGAAIAASFARSGAHVAVTGRSAGKLKGLAGELSAHGVRALHLRVDTLEAHEQAAAALERVHEELGRIDIMVNCAQAAKAGVLLHDLEPADLQGALDSGLMSAFSWMKAAYSHLRATRGCVVNLVSVAGLRGVSGQGPLAAAKEGLRGLSRVAAADWADAGIRVSCLAALARTAGFERWEREFAQEGEDLAAQMEAEGLVSCERVGDACVQLACSGTSGQTWTVGTQGLMRA